jgi:hypothetical protein
MGCGIFCCSLPGLAGPDLKGEAVLVVEHTRRAGTWTTTRVRGHAITPGVDWDSEAPTVATIAGKEVGIA